jgi:hypothetical protein
LQGMQQRQKVSYPGGDAAPATGAGRGAIRDYGGLRTVIAAGRCPQGGLAADAVAVFLLHSGVSGPGQCQFCPTADGGRFETRCRRVRVRRRYFLPWIFHF